MAVVDELDMGRVDVLAHALSNNKNNNNKCIYRGVFKFKHEVLSRLKDLQNKNL